MSLVAQMSFVLIDIAKIRRILAYSKWLSEISPKLLRQGGNETTKAVYRAKSCRLSSACFGCRPAFCQVCLYRYRLEEVVSTEADTVEQIETELVAACNILHPSVVVVETIAEVRSQRYLVRYAVGDSRNYEYAEPVEVAL